MSDLKQAVERLSRVASEPGCDVVVDSADLRLVLSALSRAEAERDLLAAECRAWRDAYDNNDCDGESGHCRCAGAPDSVLAATDAAGVLKEGK